MFLLLKISNIFRLSSGFTVLQPDFPVPEGRFPQASQWPASVFREAELLGPCEITLYLTHFNIRDSFDANRRWRIVPGLEKDQNADIAIGDDVVVDAARLVSTFGLASYPVKI